MVSCETTLCHNTKNFTLGANWTVTILFLLPSPALSSASVRSSACEWPSFNYFVSRVMRLSLKTYYFDSSRCCGISPPSQNPSPCSLSFSPSSPSHCSAHFSSRSPLAFWKRKMSSFSPLLLPSRFPCTLWLLPPLLSLSCHHLFNREWNMWRGKSESGKKWESERVEMKMIK